MPLLYLYVLHLIIAAFILPMKLYLLYKTKGRNFVLPSLILMSPDNTFCLTSSLSEFKILCPLSYVSCDTPASFDISFRVSIGFTGFAEFCKGRGLQPPVEVFKFSFAFSS